MRVPGRAMPSGNPTRYGASAGRFRSSSRSHRPSRHQSATLQPPRSPQDSTQYESRRSHGSPTLGSGSQRSPDGVPSPAGSAVGVGAAELAGPLGDAAAEADAPSAGAGAGFGAAGFGAAAVVQVASEARASSNMRTHGASHGPRRGARIAPSRSRSIAPGERDSYDDSASSASRSSPSRTAHWYFRSIATANIGLPRTNYVLFVGSRTCLTPPSDSLIVKTKDLARQGYRRCRCRE
jgi:hypothetical protein